MFVLLCELWGEGLAAPGGDELAERARKARD